MAPWAKHLVPLLPAEDLESFLPLIRQSALVQISAGDRTPERIEEIKACNEEAIVCVRLPLTPHAEDEAEFLVGAGAEAIHFLADAKGREQGTSSPQFTKDRIRSIHQLLVKKGLRDRVTLLFGGGIALAEHVAKAIICGADAVSVERPLLVSLDCRLCGGCKKGESCPVGVGNIEAGWGRQRVINLVAAWHGQLLEVLGAMGMRDVRRLRGEMGRAIFREEIERETFGQIFGRRTEARRPAAQPVGEGEEVRVLAT
jgi:glutamate synthase domain-containing protein 2